MAAARRAAARLLALALVVAVASAAGRDDSAPMVVSKSTVSGTKDLAMKLADVMQKAANKPAVPQKKQAPSDPYKQQRDSLKNYLQDIMTRRMAAAAQQQSGTKWQELTQQHERMHKAQMERNRKNHHKKLDDSAKRERARRLAGWTLNALGRLGKHAWAGTKKVGKKIAGWAKNLFKRKTKNSDKQLKNDMKKAKLTFMRQKSKLNRDIRKEKKLLNKVNGPPKLVLPGSKGARAAAEQRAAAQRATALNRKIHDQRVADKKKMEDDYRQEWGKRQGRACVRERVDQCHKDKKKQLYQQCLKRKGVGKPAAGAQAANNKPAAPAAAKAGGRKLLALVEQSSAPAQKPAAAPKAQQQQQQQQQQSVKQQPQQQQQPAKQQQQQQQQPAPQQPQTAEEKARAEELAQEKAEDEQDRLEDIKQECEDSARQTAKRECGAKKSTFQDKCGAKFGVKLR